MSDDSVPATPADKPEGAKIGWHLRRSRHAFTGKINRLRHDEVTVAGRGDIEYSYLERGESVIIVPVTAGGQMALIRHYRYPVDAFCYELPAGCCRDQGAAALEEVARRELREEIGGVAGSLDYVTWFYSSSSISDEVCHIFLALDVELSLPPETEPGEHIQTLLVPAAEAVALVRRGEMKTGTCALAILHCEERLRGCGVLPG